METSILVRAEGGEQIAPYVESVRGLQEDFNSSGIKLETIQMKSFVDVSNILISIGASVAATYVVRLLDSLKAAREASPNCQVLVIVEYKGQRLEGIDAIDSFAQSIDRDTLDE